jgi:hypothetical protein
MISRRKNYGPSKARVAELKRAAKDLRALGITEEQASRYEASVVKLEAKQGNMPETVGETVSAGAVVDADAEAIGELYRKARGSYLEATRALIECGHKLIAKQRELKAGGVSWISWLEENAEILAFRHRTTASRLMKLARDASTHHRLTEDEALQLNRATWGNLARLEAPEYLAGENERTAIEESGAAAVLSVWVDDTALDPEEPAAEDAKQRDSFENAQGVVPEAESIGGLELEHDDSPRSTTGKPPWNRMSNWERLEHALFIINEHCTTNEMLMVPCLTTAQREEAVASLVASISGLEELLTRVRAVAAEEASADRCASKGESRPDADGDAGAKEAPTPTAEEASSGAAAAEDYPELPECLNRRARKQTEGDDEEEERKCDAT